eukprot:TRINITY_DN18350_c0_g1_i1.p1 TRINITY_DN18350_c0_g1~~TRINITY_DN18350_c0_g1_i1.p1  ORF type:complete len:241 (+),score=103.58 TRINITY_DN18350_c0_g1_i1:52-723(+)
MALPKVLVNVTSDVLCPFCWIGKRSLETALDQRRDVADFEVVWHPFFLREHIPDGGIDKLEGYSEKFGREKAQALLLGDQSPFKAYGRQLGLQFNHKDGCRIGDTHKAHRLLWLAKDTLGHAKQNELSEVLFRQYFQENRNPGDIDTVLDAAEEVGLDRADTRKFLQSDDLLTEVTQYYRKAQMRGITGVPHFDITGPTGRKVSTGGARQPEEFVSLIDGLLR